MNIHTTLSQSAHENCVYNQGGSKCDLYELNEAEKFSQSSVKCA